MTGTCHGIRMFLMSVFIPSTNIKKLPKWSPKIKLAKGIKDLINE